MVLDSQPDGEVADGEQAVALVLATSPDIVLMDVRIPGVDRVEATRRIIASASSRRPAQPVDDRSVGANHPRWLSGCPSRGAWCS